MIPSLSLPEPDVAEIARKLTKAQRAGLIAGEYRGSGVSSFVVVDCLAVRGIPSTLAHMLTLRWDRLTPLGLAVRAHLQESPDAHR
jgi:hypothetical protein